MSSEGSITRWIEKLKTGDPAAAQALWEHYFQRLAGLAHKRLRGTPCRVTDGEDVALSVLDSVCRAAQCGRFPDLQDRHDLWRLLMRLTQRKAADHAKHEGREKRGGGKVRGESVFLGAGSCDSDQFGIEQVLAREPTPEDLALLEEGFLQMLRILPTDEDRSIALWKVEGYTNQEIAEKSGRSLRSVERRLSIMRDVCEREVAS